MNIAASTVANNHNPKSLVSIGSRAMAALGVVSVLVLAVMGTAQASHDAVDSCTVALSRSTTHVTLPKVEIVGRRSVANNIGA